MLKTEDKPAYLALSRIPNSEVDILWHIDYYDKPLTGMAEWRGRKYWFDTIGEDMPDQNEFYLIELPGSEIRKAMDIQNLRRSMSESGDSWDEFLAARDLLAQPDYSQGNVIGWCMWSEAGLRQVDETFSL